jgi:hypothetical protein
MNTGNSCFVNSVVQALLASDTFCGILAVLQRCTRLIDPAAAPALAALAALAAEFQPHGPGDAAAAEQQQQEGEQQQQQQQQQQGEQQQQQQQQQQQEDGAGWAEVARSGKRGKGAAGPPAPAPAAQPPASAAAALGIAVVLGAKPLTPAMLNPLVHRFSPKQAAAQSNGRVSMAQVRQPGSAQGPRFVAPARSHPATSTHLRCTRRLGAGRCITAPPPS